MKELYVISNIYMCFLCYLFLVIFFAVFVYVLLVIVAVVEGRGLVRGEIGMVSIDLKSL